VGGHVVMMEEPVVTAPKFRSFSSHIFSQASQNVTVRVKIRVGGSVTRNKFTVNNHLHIEKTKNKQKTNKKQTNKKTMCMLFAELCTYSAFFALGDCGLFRCNDCCFVSGS
jgi:hypothetical protein